MTNPIRIISRSSKLACVQVQEILNLMPEPLDVDIQTLDSKGDKDKTTSLQSKSPEMNNFFTDTLDEAILTGEADIAIHSAKDLPVPLPKGLDIFALTKSIDETDSLVSKQSLQELPGGAKIGSSSPARRQALLELREDVVPTEIRGTIEERIAKVTSGEMDGVIVATCALKRLQLDNHIQEILPWDAVPLQGQLAVVGRANDFKLRKTFSKIDARNAYGKVHLVGAGPGDPQLITLKAIDRLKNADCVFYDYLLDKSILRYAPRAEHIYVGKRKGLHSLPQKQLSRMLREKAQQGLNVVRLKGGDPFIFGRGSEELLYLRSFHIKTEVVPGVSSATGIASSLEIPLTSRDLSRSVSFITGHGANETCDSQAPIEIPKTDTLVVMMGLTKLPIIIKTMLEDGWDPNTPVLIVSEGTRENQTLLSGKINDIVELQKQNPVSQPAIILIGPTIKLWNENPALQSNVLYTGTTPSKYAFLGNIIHHPMIQIAGCVDSKDQQHQIIEQFRRRDGVILTSRFAVKYFMDIIIGIEDAETLCRQKEFVVIGTETGRTLEDYGVKPNVVAKIETSSGLLKEMIVHYKDLSNMDFIFPRSSLSNPFLKEQLSKRGVTVQEINVYTNTKPAEKPLPQEHIDQILFTSPSTVQNFLEDYDTIPSEWTILSKGPRTEAELEKHGYKGIRINVKD